MMIEIDYDIYIYDTIYYRCIDHKWVFEDQFLNIETCRRTTPPLTQMIFFADFY